MKQLVCRCAARQEVMACRDLSLFDTLADGSCLKLGLVEHVFASIQLMGSWNLLRYMFLFPTRNLRGILERKFRCEMTFKD